MDIQATDEQKRILEATGRIIKINARAGTGKTTTLCLIAEHNRDKKILYLVFNKKNRDEAERIFPPNVKIKTVHAFARFSLSSFGKRFDTDDNFNVCTFLPYFGKERNRQTLATLSYNFLTFFLNSGFEKLEKAISPYIEDCLTEEQKKTFNHHEKRIIQITRDFATSWNKNEISCPHDFYLKLSHIKKTFHKELEKFDIILVDEGQDLSHVMLDSLSHCTKRIVLVGDTHQRIYSFRYAVDAMRIMKCDEDFALSLSFRFGERIADLVTMFILQSKNETNFKICGYENQKSVVSFYSDLSIVNQGVKTAILSRTNMALFKNAMYMRSKKIRFSFERDIKSELIKTLDVYRLYRGEKKHIKDGLIQSFDSIEQLDKYAEDVQDFQLSNISKIVKDYADEFPKAIYEMMTLTKKNEHQNDKDAIVLSTVHAAKGQEYDRVIIDQDIVDAISRTKSINPEQFNDEINVAYVCFTRAKKQLLLPVAFKTVLTPQWQSYIEKLAFKSYDRTMSNKTHMVKRARNLKPQKNKTGSKPGYWFNAPEKPKKTETSKKIRLQCL